MCNLGITANTAALSRSGDGSTGANSLKVRGFATIPRRKAPHTGQRNYWRVAPRKSWLWPCLGLAGGLENYGAVHPVTDCTHSHAFLQLAGRPSCASLNEGGQTVGGTMDEMTMRSRARLLLSQLESTIGHCREALDNGRYAGALVEGQAARPRLTDLCVILEMLAEKQP